MSLSLQQRVLFVIKRNSHTLTSVFWPDDMWITIRSISEKEEKCVHNQHPFPFLGDLTTTVTHMGIREQVFLAIVHYTHT